MLHFRGDISPRESRKTTSHRSSTRYYFNCNSNFLLDIVVEQIKNQLWSVLMRNVAFFYCRNQPPSNFKVHKVTALSVSLCLCVCLRYRLSNRYGHEYCSVLAAPHPPHCRMCVSSPMGRFEMSQGRVCQESG